MSNPTSILASADSPVLATIGIEERRLSNSPITGQWSTSQLNPVLLTLTV
jgi:hypothetical protein